ncbi:MAG: bifunctional phosphoribosyl-AMP cyclohydrolase/phosphoribosyl-ATP diphosphatase HisIE [Candidatus Thermoplasmatota archaeon]
MTLPDWASRVDFAKGGGLVPCVAQDHATGRILMVAWMDAAALAKTIASGEMHYHSRSKGRLWRKGEESGHTQTLVGLALDCDGDTLVAQVTQKGPACHTGAATCFSQIDGRSEPILVELDATIEARKANPTGWTGKLLADANLRRKKVAEEAAELVMASMAGDHANLIHEAADLWYHSLVVAQADGVTLAEILQELAKRHAPGTTPTPK